MNFDAALAPCFHSKNPYRDPATGRYFFIQYPDKLSPYELLLTFTKYVADQKEIEFRLWRQRPENRSWRGDEDAKKQELFNSEHNDRPFVVVGGGIATLALVEDFAARMLNEQECVEVSADALWDQGVDVDQLGKRISSYQVFPDEARNFAFEKLPAPTCNPHRFAFKVTRLRKSAA